MDNELRPPHFVKTDERWADLAPGYLISDRGRVYSLKNNRILRTQKNSSGYYRVPICQCGIQHLTFIHIKVVELFGDRLGKHIPADLEALRNAHLSIDHLDRNKKNNSIQNLELVTHKENCLRKFRNITLVADLLIDSVSKKENPIIIVNEKYEQMDLCECLGGFYENR